MNCGSAWYTAYRLPRKIFVSDQREKTAGSVAVCIFMVRYYLFLCNRSGNGFCGRDQNAATASWLSVFHAVFG